MTWRSAGRATPVLYREEIKLQDNIAVRFEEVSMQFPEVLANDHVSLDIKAGEVFALVGENGAGKSTLMNILYGIHKPTD